MSPAERRPAPLSPGGESDADALERLERGLVAVMSWLVDRDTLGRLARQSGHALPPASWALLEHLDARGSMRVSDVAACHGVHTSSIIPRLKALEHAGLIERGGDPDDARVSIIAITVTGRDALQSIHIARQETLERALDGVEHEQVAAAADVLIAIAGRLAREPVTDGSR